MTPVLDIPGIVRVSIKIDYNQYQQFMTIAYHFLDTEGMLSPQSDFNNRVVEAAISQTIQDMVGATFVSAEPETVIELLKENTRLEHKKLASKFLPPLPQGQGIEGG